MTDPNFAHEFLPNREGRCKRVIGSRICGLVVADPVHTRFGPREQGTSPMDVYERFTDSATVNTNTALYRCWTCGAVVEDRDVHHKWHNELERFMADRAISDVKY